MTTNNIPLRIFMGLHMLGWSLSIQNQNLWKLDQVHDAGWLWAVTVMMSGMWLVVTALLELHARKLWPKTWSAPQRGKFRILAKCSAAGYFFSGAVWGGLGAHALGQNNFREVDLLCPLYMVFLMYLAFSDASVKRKGVELNNENKRNAVPTAALLRPGSPARIHTERASR